MIMLSIIHHPHLQLPLFPLDWMKLEDFGLKDEVGASWGVRFLEATTESWSAGQRVFLFLSLPS